MSHNLECIIKICYPEFQSGYEAWLSIDTLDKTSVSHETLDNFIVL